MLSVSEDKEKIKAILEADTTAFKKRRKSASYYNSHASFDIETTSTYVNKDEKMAFMYIWAFHIMDVSIMGRTWEEFIDLIKMLQEIYDLSPNSKHMIIWVHNLSFEFSFMAKYFTWLQVFALDERQPVKALCSYGIEFRCSYHLSAYSLATVAKHLRTHQIAKLIGDLDYDLVRTSITPMTDQELEYLNHDVLIVSAYIDEQIEEYGGNITNLPLTNTGRVRSYCRKECRYVKGKDGKTYSNRKFNSMIQQLTIEPEELEMLEGGFAGGFTHSNAIRVGNVYRGVFSVDFTSSYPTVMIAERYPMSKGRKVAVRSLKEFNRYIDCYCCLFKIELENLRARPEVFDNPLSYSKAQIDGKYTLNNGRVVEADHVITVITDVDYKVLVKFYEWDHMAVSNFYIYRRGYLPTEFVKSILKLYGDKTTLKNVKGQEVEYLRSKGMLNSCYGMSVTSIDKPMFTYDESGWYDEGKGTVENLRLYNESKNRFLFYPWGVWVTAYARANLFTGIYELGADYIYADTDSLKFLNKEKHQKYFDEYNSMIIKKLYDAMDYHGLSHDLIEPKTIKGVKKPLGVWDYEGEYEEFKTLGAKRYIVKHDGQYEITIAGLGKKAGRDYLVNTYGDSIMDHFNNNMYIPAESTGKMTHTYIDEYKEADIIDYRGNKTHVTAPSGVHLEKVSFDMTMASEFIDYLKGLKQFKD